MFITSSLQSAQLVGVERGNKIRRQVLKGNTLEKIDAVVFPSVMNAPDRVNALVGVVVRHARNLFS